MQSTGEFFKNFHKTMNRRQLLKALGLTAGAVSLGGSVAYGQGGENSQEGPRMNR